MYSDPYTNVKTIDTRLGQTKVASPFKYNNQGKPVDPATGNLVAPEPTAPNDIIKLGESKIGLNNNQAQKFLGMDMTQISENWKEKGGFEGLMANPGFLLGMSILQSSAQGKSIGSVEYLMRQLKLEQCICCNMQIELKLELQLLHLLVMLNELQL
jgi:hypothetical protein